MTYFTVPVTYQREGAGICNKSQFPHKPQQATDVGRRPPAILTEQAMNRGLARSVSKALNPVRRFWTVLIFRTCDRGEPKESGHVRRHGNSGRPVVELNPQPDSLLTT